MSVQLKPLDQQVIVVTGASSGIGLATARTASARGARVVLAARSTRTLEAVARELTANGTEALALTVDVGKRDEVEQVASRTLERFGRIDTWINNAGVSIYGWLDEIPDDEARRLFDTNFWGVVNGSLVALPYLRAQGGALINVGSEVSDAVIPLQGMYAASKHAVKGFTDNLRVEMEVDEAPVSVTLIQPTAVNTPYPQHARNHMDQEPKLPTPQIDPQQVADAILEAAERPARDVTVGTMAKLNTATARLAPRLGDRMAAKQTGRQQYREPPRHAAGTLFEAGESGRTHGSGGAG